MIGTSSGGHKKREFTAVNLRAKKGGEEIEGKEEGSICTGLRFRSAHYSGGHPTETPCSRSQLTVTPPPRWSLTRGICEDSGGAPGAGDRPLTPQFSRLYSSVSSLAINIWPYMPRVHATCTCHVYMPRVHTTCTCHVYIPRVHATCI